MNSSETKILVTGVAGLIGSHMAEYLVSKGYKVFGVDNLSGGYIENVPHGVEFFEADLSNTGDLAIIFESTKPDYVYHFAAYAAEGLSPFIRNFNYSNNLLCSVNVINECIKHDVKRVIFASSMAVYGKGVPPFNEGDNPEPVDPYGISKYAVEMDLEQAKQQFGLDYAVVRPHNVIGIRQNIWDKYRNVVGIWIRRVLNGQSIVIFGDGEQTRAFSDIKFCLEPMERLLERKCLSKPIYNIGSDKEYTLNEVANIVKEVAKELGFNAKIEHAEARHEVKHASCDHRKAKVLLEFDDQTNLRKTIKDMFVWAKDQPDREVKRMRYELEVGMYNHWK